jgi:hypothetical protein
LKRGPTEVFVSGRSYEPGPLGLMYLCASGSFPLSLNPFVGFKSKLPLLDILGAYYPGPRGLMITLVFLGDFPKVVKVDE